MFGYFAFHLPELWHEKAESACVSLSRENTTGDMLLCLMNDLLIDVKILFLLFFFFFVASCKKKASAY